MVSLHTIDCFSDLKECAGFMILNLEIREFIQKTLCHKAIYTYLRHCLNKKVYVCILHNIIWGIPGYTVTEAVVKSLKQQEAQLSAI